jgi:tetratricopeptide (TPR) repeat protein
MDRKFIALLDQLHEDDQFHQIIQHINNIPRNQWTYDLINHLARAYNNADFFDEALKLLESCREQGAQDHLWHFRKAYAHYYKNENELAKPSFEQALQLNPSHEDSLMFLKAIEDEDNFEEAVYAEGSSFVVAQLNARLQPIDRGELFEDPLDEILQEANLGRISGGGTMLTDEREVAYCDIEINLNELNDQSLQKVIQELENLGAPKGSLLKMGKQAIEFGVSEGLAIYLNGSDLPDEVYQNCDSNIVYTEISRLIEGEGMIMSHWQGPTETALYLYGNSFTTLQELIREFIDTYPLCQKCRIVQIA